MEVRAQSKYVRISPRKARGVASVVKKLSLSEAEAKLALLPKKAAGQIRKTLHSAIANAQNAKDLNKEVLKIKNIIIDEGLKMKRRDKSHGARYGGGVIQKRTSHITVILEG